MAIEVGLIALVFQDENGHPDDPMALPDSTSWEAIKQGSISLDENTIVPNIDDLWDNASFDGGHDDLYFLENPGSIPIFAKT